MLIKARTETEELRQYRCLNSRMELESAEKQHLINLEKGYEGEVEFDRIVNEIGCGFLTLNDVLLEKQGTYIQLDSLLISVDKIYLFEIKNFEGDFYVEGDKWYSRAGTEIENPLLQLSRRELQLRRYLQTYHPSLPIVSYLVFINPNFTLYQMPLNDTIIFPTQLQRFLKKLLSTRPQFKEQHIQLGRKIVSGHLEKSPFTKVPSFNYEQLQKGIVCQQCKSIETSVSGDRLICEACRAEEKLDLAILRSIAEFQLLFPERRLTTNGIFEWCGVVKSKKTIKRVLTSHYERIGYGKYTYYSSDK